jgi:hypothetical protein
MIYFIKKEVCQKLQLLTWHFNSRYRPTTIDYRSMHKQKIVLEINAKVSSGRRLM